MSFKEVQVTCDEGYREILIAEMGAIGYDSMMETEPGFNAYIEANRFDSGQVEELRERYAACTVFGYTICDIPKENWNETWEKNYAPIIIEDQCIVRASFHQVDKGYPYEIIIDPKMSFGTGHHETTYLMLLQQMELDHQGKRVMDAGCGTGILAIMASKRGCTGVEAFDIDPWCVENGQENLGLNGISNAQIRLGKLKEMDFEGKFDIILANINKNVLLEELPLYQDYLSTGGHLMMSGFYGSDVDDLVVMAEKLQLKLEGKNMRNRWASLTFSKLMPV